MNEKSSIWMQWLSLVRTPEEAEQVVRMALNQGKRSEILCLLRGLYEEYVGPDPWGGSCGTLQNWNNASIPNVTWYCVSKLPNTSSVAQSSRISGRSLKNFQLLSFGNGVTATPTVAPALF